MPVPVDAPLDELLPPDELLDTPLDAALPVALLAAPDGPSPESASWPRTSSPHAARSNPVNASAAGLETERRKSMAQGIIAGRALK